MSQPTPGPWHLEEQNEDGEVHVLIVSEPGAELGYPRESLTIAESSFENSPRGLANARLIAQAPAMREALETALSEGMLGAHNAHWDAEGNAGRTCPACIANRKIADIFRTLLKAIEG